MLSLSIFLKGLRQKVKVHLLQPQTTFHPLSTPIQGGLLVGDTLRSSLSFRKHIRRKRGTIFFNHLLRLQLCRFLLSLWGAPISLVLLRNLQLRFSIPELVFLYLQNHRVFACMPASFRNQRQLRDYAWRFGATALYLGVAVRDPFLILAWMQHRLQKVNLFQHRRFFRTLALMLAIAVQSPKLRYSIRGIHLQLTGKISVTGNAMSRTYLVRRGVQANSSLSLRTAQSFNLVRTRTGCLGLWLNFYF